MKAASVAEAARVRVLQALYARSNGFCNNLGGALACQECGCLDIQVTAWRDANTGETGEDDAPSAAVWCPECETHTDDGWCNVAERGGRIFCITHGDGDCKAALGLHIGTKWDEPKAGAK